MDFPASDWPVQVEPLWRRLLASPRKAQAFTPRAATAAIRVVMPKRIGECLQLLRGQRLHRIGIDRTLAQQGAIGG